jgi:hypothetical protein
MAAFHRRATVPRSHRVGSGAGLAASFNEYSANVLGDPSSMCSPVGPLPRLPTHAFSQAQLEFVLDIPDICTSFLFGFPALTSLSVSYEECRTSASGF